MHEHTILFLLFLPIVCPGRYYIQPENRLVQVFAWKQLKYDINGVIYDSNANTERRPSGIIFDQVLEDKEKFFIQYNNVPVGFEVYEDKVFVTVPRRKYGIPSTLNYVSRNDRGSPALKPYPDEEGSKDLVSVYRPRVDACDRLWMLDTGLLEVPGNKQQLQPPSIVIYDLKTNKRLLKYELNKSVLVNERTPGGLTSITVDVTKQNCDDAYAYINDLATEGLVVFSLKQLDSWRYEDESFKLDPHYLNFTVAGLVVTWRDNLFSIALSEPDASGNRKAFYHPMVSVQEFSVDTEILKKRLPFKSTLIGTKDGNTRSGSSGYHAASRAMFEANVAQNAINCWSTDNVMSPTTVPIVLQDSTLLMYIADLKIVGDEVWVLVNQMPRFVLSTLNINEPNFYIHKVNVRELIRGTWCEEARNRISYD